MDRFVDFRSVQNGAVVHKETRQFLVKNGFIKKLKKIHSPQCIIYGYQGQVQ